MLPVTLPLGSIRSGRGTDCMRNRMSDKLACVRLPVVRRKQGLSFARVFFRSENVLFVCDIRARRSHPKPITIRFIVFFAIVSLPFARQTRGKLSVVLARRLRTTVSPTRNAPHCFLTNLFLGRPRLKHRADAQTCSIRNRFPSFS